MISNTSWSLYRWGGGGAPHISCLLHVKHLLHLLHPPQHQLATAACKLNSARQVQVCDTILRESDGFRPLAGHAWLLTLLLIGARLYCYSLHAGLMHQV